MTFSITRERIGTTLGKLVYDKLIEVLKDDNFIISVFSEIKGDARKQDLLNWLDENKTCSADDILDYLEDKYEE